MQKVNVPVQGFIPPEGNYYEGDAFRSGSVDLHSVSFLIGVQWLICVLFSKIVMPLLHDGERRLPWSAVRARERTDKPDIQILIAAKGNKYLFPSIPLSRDSLGQPLFVRFCETPPPVFRNLRQYLSRENR